VSQTGLVSRKPAWSKAGSPMLQACAAMLPQIVKSTPKIKTQLFYASH